MWGLRQQRADDLGLFVFSINPSRCVMLLIACMVGGDIFCVVGGMECWLVGAASSDHTLTKRTIAAVYREKARR